MLSTPHIAAGTGWRTVVALQSEQTTVIFQALEIELNETEKKNYEKRTNNCNVS